LIFFIASLLLVVGRQQPTSLDARYWLASVRRALEIGGDKPDAQRRDFFSRAAVARVDASARPQRHRSRAKPANRAADAFEGAPKLTVRDLVAC
jgi:hypothetical protein